MNARNPKRKATADLSEMEKLNRHKENLLTVAVASAAGQTHPLMTHPLMTHPLITRSGSGVLRKSTSARHMHSHTFTHLICCTLFHPLAISHK